MTRKISLSIFAVSLLTLIISILLSVVIFSGYFRRSVERDLESEAKIAAQGVLLAGEAYFDSLDTPNRISWISEDGRVLCDSHLSASLLGSHADREEFAEAQENGTGVSYRYSDTLSEQTVNYALRLNDGSVIRVSTTRDTSLAVFVEMIYYVIIACIFILLVSFALARHLSHKIVEPINELDLESPEISVEYKELSPLLDKVKRQTELIRNQLTHLKQTAEKFQTITENMAEGIVILDCNQRILSYNPASVRLLGGNAATDGVLSLNRDERFSEGIEQALSGEHSKMTVTDSERCYDVFINPVKLDEGTGAVMVILDVTDKDRAEQLRREFSSNVSHELKTPLASIYGISEIMANGMIKEEDVPRFAKDINTQSGRLITLVNDIIRLSQLDEGTFGEEKCDVELLLVAEEAVGVLSSAAEAKNIGITLLGDKAHIEGIRSIIYEMIYNLLDNALKYNRDGGQVTVRVARLPKPSITVTDTGIGIPAEHLSRIFERFYRVDKSHSKSIGGTGLGLSIVKHAAAYHNAEISVNSEVGRGTSVTVEFPDVK
ncbi:MAG: PAS domain-containing protein [Clostridia bacterium]|nr:PAS domain-containing protein [Clostridia bacterium]